MKNLNAFLIDFVFAVSLIMSGEIVTAQEREDIETVSIGTQEWSVTNLNVSHFRNGDPIVEARSVEEWTSAFANGVPAWCYYENDAEYGNRFGMSSKATRAYGKLYNWFAVKDRRGLAPPGWHVASFSEWDKLTIHLGGVEVADYELMIPLGSNGAEDRPSAQPSARCSASGRSRRGSTVSQNPRLREGGTNSTGFTALPAGIRSSSGAFSSYGSYGYWWSSTEYKQWPLPMTVASWYRHMTFFESQRTDLDFMTSPVLAWGNGMAVRLVRN